MKKQHPFIKKSSIFVLIMIVLFGPISGFLIMRNISKSDWSKNALKEPVENIVKEVTPFHSGTNDYKSYVNWGFDNKTLKPLVVKNDIKKGYGIDASNKSKDWWKNNVTNGGSTFHEEHDIIIGSYALGQIFWIENYATVKSNNFVAKYNIKNSLIGNPIVWMYSAFAKKAVAEKAINIIKVAKPEWIKAGATNDNIKVVENFKNTFTWHDFFDNQGQIKIKLAFKNSKTITFAIKFKYNPINPKFNTIPKAQEYNVNDWKVI